MSSDRLEPGFFLRPTEELARSLIGCCLVNEGAGKRVVGRIVETEAYLGRDDPASHSHRGVTKRNRSMFGTQGTAYVYLIYGMHLCLNVVSGPEGVGEAVLIRALEPIEGLELMGERRGRTEVHELCSGPAKLTVAMGVTREHDGVDLSAGDLELRSPTSFGVWDEDRPRLHEGPRIGITKAADLPLRYWLEGSSWVSR